MWKQFTHSLNKASIIFFTPSDAELNCDDLSDIKSNLYNARSKWEDIGLSLNIDLETLTCVKSLNRERHDDCLQEMLAHRLQATPSLTWRMLCECLRCPTVARNNVAVEIEDWIKGQAKCYIFMPRCACASEVYGSVFVRVCVDCFSCSRISEVQVRVSIGF